MSRPLPNLANDLREWAEDEMPPSMRATMIEAADAFDLIHNHLYRLQDLIEARTLPAPSMTATSLPARPTAALVEIGGTAEGLLAVLSDPSATSQGSAT